MSFPTWLLVPGTDLLPRHGRVREHVCKDEPEPSWTKPSAPAVHFAAREVADDAENLSCQGEQGCGKVKPAGDFYTYRRGSQHLYRPQCKDCYNVRYNKTRDRSAAGGSSLEPVDSAA